MAFRELTMMDVKEVLRRLVAGHGLRRIARETGIDRKTVRRYADAARDAGVEAEQALDDACVHEVARRVQSRELPAKSDERVELEAHRERIKSWLAGTAEHAPLRLTKVHALLGRQGVDVSYSTLRRFAVDELDWRKREPTVLIEDAPPGVEAQADFGKMGMVVDPTTGKRRALYALIVTLGFSRYQFVWPTFVQTTEAVCEGLDAAWRFFGGVVRHLIVDNLKPVIETPHALGGKVNDAFAEYAEARGLFVDAARVRSPKDKARVENQVAYVRESWFAGESLVGLDAWRNDARRWCVEVAGARVHGTTRRVPREVYDSEERACMQPAPTDVFDVPMWVESKVHPDHHIQVKRALYSLPTKYIGRVVRVRVDRTMVRVYDRTELIKAHPRKAPGKRSTDPNDYPKSKAAWAFRSVDDLVDQAHRKGEHVGVLAERLLDGPVPWTRMRQGYALLRMCDRYGREQVEAACRRAIAFDVIDVRRIERLLKQAAHAEDDAEERGKLVRLPVQAPLRFARTTDAFETRPGLGRDDEGEA